MQNKSAIWLFTILLTIAALYQLSQGWVADRFEQQAMDYVTAEYSDDVKSAYPDITESELKDSLVRYQRAYLRDSGYVEIYPVMGYSYNKVKEQELNFGLDLQGGMHVTLEVSLADLVKALSKNSNNPDFVNALRRAQDLQSEDDAHFIDLFEQAWNEQDASVDLWRIFNHPENVDKFPPKSTNEEIIAKLREEADAAVNNTENVIKKRIDQFGVAQPVVQKQALTGRIMVELPGVDDRDRVRKKLKSTANLEFWHTYTLGEVFAKAQQGSLAVGRANHPDLFDDADTTATDTALEPDIADPDIAVAEGDSTETAEEAIDLDTDVTEGDEELTDDEDRARREKTDPLFALLRADLSNGTSPILGYAAENDTAGVNAVINNPLFREAVPADLILVWKNRGEILGLQDAEGESIFGDTPVLSLFMLQDTEGNGIPPLDGSVVTNAAVGYDVTRPVVDMTMNAEVGTPKWRDMTQNAFDRDKRAIAICMDGFCYSAPFVQNGAIPNGRSQISLGQGSPNELLDEAKDLSELLKAGSLPAPARIVDEYSVGASLGQENIDKGLMSFIIALLVVLIYMIFYYKGAGLVSNVALIANLVFLIGALAALQAALTLPGIAGIVLTIGMAVDANVLIYERIKEEMRLGKGLGAALKDGYNKAYSAIVDANITTLLTAIILLAFGTGPIKGFATTLIIGIFTSLFSAIIITRLIFFNRLEKKKGISFSTNITKNWFTGMNYKFVARRKIFYVVSGLVIAGGLASLFTRGLDLGVDFTGGTRFVVTLEDSGDFQTMQNSLNAAFTEDGVEGRTTLQPIGQGDTRFKIETNYLSSSTADTKDEDITAALVEGLTNAGVAMVEGEPDERASVDPTMSDDFRRAAQQATIFALIVIFLYIFFRFRRWQFGLGALLAMVHDVIIVLSLFSIFYGILPFSLEIDQAFIAAILTVIGYSINDTVVVFDRIREYLIEYKRDDDNTVINRALNSTLSRTINTSLSTFVVLLTIFLFGGDTIKAFAFALMVGVVVGTYSSIFIATPVVIDFSKSVRTKEA